MLSKIKSTAALLLAALILTSAASAAQLSTTYDSSLALAPAIEGEVSGIMLTEVPLSYKATLCNGVRSLKAGDCVSGPQLKSLTFTPTGSADATAEIGYIPVYSDGSLGNEQFITVGIFSKTNTPPRANDLSLTTYKNIAITGEFSAQDDNGDMLTYEITGQPKRGQVVDNGDGSFTYTPAKNKVGKDSFTYTATDSKGSASENATVEIEITKPTSKLTYADMEGSDAHYAALRLHECGVFTGEKLGGEYFFRPEQLVTRGEFLAAVLCLTETELTAQALSTGFADEDSTPAWVKPYITTALQNGVISGVTTTEGELVFRSQAYLTGAEAAVIINNVLELSDAAPIMAADTVPAWAYQAAANLGSAGIISSQAGGAFSLSDTMTRADMAQMLSATLDLLEEKDTGLLSWVFD